MILTDAQREAITRYIAGRYVEINGDCRGDSSGDMEVVQDIFLLDGAVAKSALAHQQVVYRGVDRTYADELERRDVKAGDIIADKGFLRDRLRMG